MTDIDDLLAEAKPAERSLPVCLRADLVAEFEDLERQLDDARRAVPADSLAGSGGEARRIAEQMEDLRQRMQAATRTFRLRAMARRKFRELVDAHPPRKDEDGNRHPDDGLGVNMATFFDPLLRACLVDPALTDERWARLNEVLSGRQWDLLASTAWAVNRGDVDVPFSPAASRLLMGSATASPPPNASE